MLNPSEPHHLELLGNMKEATERVLLAINRKKGMAEELDEAADQVVAASQRILKSEWERVKRGD